jgi:hypothetical protein
MSDCFSFSDGLSIASPAISSLNHTPMSDKRRDRFVRFATVATIFFEDACLAMAQVESGQSDIQEQISIQAVQDFWDLPLISSGATRSV